MNVLKPHLKNTVITLAQQGISQHEIHRKTGIDRKTIRHHVRAMLAAALEGDPNSSTPATGSMVQPELQIPPPRPPAFAAAIAPATPKIARSACEPHREWIEAQVRVGRNAMSIYQELVDERGFSQRYNSVKRFCRGLRQCEPEQFDRLEFSPGE